MNEVAAISQLDDTPIYTIGTVVQKTGLPSATLRAWERRYAMFSPDRSIGGYRLYSEQDIATVRWLQRQVQEGVTISRAVARLQHLRQTQPPEAPGGLLADVAGARSAAEISDDLLLALLDFREAQAEVILSEAFALHPVEMVAEEIIAPTLVEVGKRWHRGDASVVQEHFATAFLRRRFIALFQAYGQSEQGLLAITGSAPGEWHDMGILLVSLALRRQGWRVIYLGQNVPAAELTAQIPFLRPALVCLSATMEQNAVGLCETVQAITALPEDVRPLLALGGRAFNENPALCEQFPNALMSPTARGLLSALPR